MGRIYDMKVLYLTEKYGPVYATLTLLASNLKPHRLGKCKLGFCKITW